MVGSQDAADSWNGEGAAACGRLRRYSLPAALLLVALLGGCSAAAPPSASASAPASVPAAIPAFAPAGTPALTGLSAEAVLSLLGKPDFRRVEPPAELWQYRRAACVLDLFLYRDAGGIRVVYAETREHGVVRAEAGRCAGEARDGHLRQSRL